MQKPFLGFLLSHYIRSNEIQMNQNARGHHE
jgi:hypothetical protein